LQAANDAALLTQARSALAPLLTRANKQLAKMDLEIKGINMKTKAKTKQSSARASADGDANGSSSSGGFVTYYSIVNTVSDAAMCAAVRVHSRKRQRRYYGRYM
jgi:hypothetical protein